MVSFPSGVKNTGDDRVFLSLFSGGADPGQIHADARPLLESAVLDPAQSKRLAERLVTFFLNQHFRPLGRSFRVLVSWPTDLGPHLYTTEKTK